MYKIGPLVLRLRHLLLTTLLLPIFLAPLPTQAKGGRTQFSVAGNLWLHPEVADGGGTLDFSGGVSVRMEHYLNDYLALGGSFDVTGLDIEEPCWASTNWILPVVGVLGTVKVAVPFGDRKSFEPYLRLEGGYGAILPIAQATSNGWGWNTQHGWVAKGLSGFQYTFASGLGLFLEVGWSGVGYRIDGEDVMYHSAVVDFGLAYRF